MGCPARAEAKEGQAGAGAAAGVTGPPAQHSSGSRPRPHGLVWAAELQGQPRRQGPSGLRDLWLWDPTWRCTSRSLCFLLCVKKTYC